jgi:hypothetical protein
MKKLIQVLCLILIISCAEESKDSSVEPFVSRIPDKDEATDAEPILSMQMRQILAIARQGDINAYNSLQARYWKSDKEGEFLCYALVFAHKYDRAFAYLDVYSELVGIMQLGNFVDSNLASLAVSYLFKAAQKGYSPAIRKIEIHNMHPDMDAADYILKTYRIRPDTIAN